MGWSRDVVLVRAFMEVRRAISQAGEQWARERERGRENIKRAQREQEVGQIDRWNQ